MLLSNRLIAVLGLLFLSACGFEPAYGTGGTAEGLRGDILVEAPKTRSDFALNEQLELRLGRAGSQPRYVLEVTTLTEREGLAISGSNDITRYNLLGRSEFTLRDAASGDAVFNDQVNTFTAYSASQQPVATLSAERDARQRLMIALADKITSKLLIRSNEF